MAGGFYRFKRKLSPGVLLPFYSETAGLLPYPETMASANRHAERKILIANVPVRTRLGALSVC